MLRQEHARYHPFMHLCCMQITVDGDTSTNDTVIGLASGEV